MAASSAGESPRTAAPDLPGPREPFTAGHLARWPMGAGRAELDAGQVTWRGDFDERDAMTARRAFPGHLVRVEPGTGLVAGPMPADRHERREWTDEDGTEWTAIGPMVLFRRPGERNWTLQPWTAQERRRNREQLAAYDAESWATDVAQYAAQPGDIEASWRYLQAHPIFWSWSVPAHLAGTGARDVDEAVWARIVAESRQNRDTGMYEAFVHVGRDQGELADSGAYVSIEHGPTLWPLDVPAEHRFGMKLGGTPSHDPDLDVAEPTWEQAVTAFAARVRDRYGDDRARVPEGQS